MKTRYLWQMITIGLKLIWWKHMDGHTNPTYLYPLNSREDAPLILDALKQAYITKNNRHWDNIYIAVDLHGTICSGLYTNNQKINFYPDAIKTLQLLSSRKEIKLILFTSTHPKDIIRYLNAHVKKHVNANYS